MALVASGYHSEVTLVDQGGNRSTLGFEFSPSVADFATALAAQIDLNTDLLGVTTATISSYSVSQRYREDALTLPTDAQVENKASISYTKSGGGLGNLKIPAPVEAMFVGVPGSGANNNIVLLQYTGLMDYIFNFTAGGQFTISDGETLIQTVRGKRIHARSSRG